MALITFNDLPQEIINKIVVDIVEQIIDEHTHGLADINHVSRVVVVCHKFMEAVKEVVRRKKRKLEDKLGTNLLASIYNDALAASSFPPYTKLNLLTTDEKKKEAMKKHLTDWRALKILKEHAITHEFAAYRLIDKTIIPFAEDFALKTTDLDAKEFQMCLPEWAETSLKRGYEPLVLEVPSITSYDPDESRRILRAFCRFELLSHVIRARPGLQLWDLKAQHRLLGFYFEQHEMEEVLCVFQYVNDLHVYLFRAFMSADHGRDVREEFRQICRDFKPVNGAWKIPERYNITSSGDPGTQWYARHLHDPTRTQIPLDKIQFIDSSTQSTVVKQIATFGLDFLRLFLTSPIQKYKKWMIKYSDTILRTICTPAEAEHVGAGPEWTWSGIYGSALDSCPFVTIPGRRVGWKCETDTPNTAWKVLGHGDYATLTGFRRCGWVFWSDARLRARRFWAIKDIDPDQIAIDLDASENQWIAAPLPQVPVEDLSDSYTFRFLLGNLRSLADYKLHRFVEDAMATCRHRKRDWYFAKDLAGHCIALITFEEMFGPLFSPELPMPVEVSPGVFWG